MDRTTQIHSLPNAGAKLKIYEVAPKVYCFIERTFQVLSTGKQQSTGDEFKE